MRTKEDKLKAQKEWSKSTMNLANQLKCRDLQVEVWNEERVKLEVDIFDWKENKFIKYNTTLN